VANVQIKHRYTDAVLFECEVPDEVEIGLRTRHALEKATAARADLRDANLSGADLSGAYLRDADLSGADLSGAYLRDAYLRDANLSGAYLRDADLSGAYLRDANLSGADLSGADLRDANLSGANLSGANLSGAYLSGAYLRDANLSGAYLSGAKVKNLALVGERPFMSIGPIGSCMRTVFAWLTEDGLRIEAGCFFGTRDEFVEQLGDTHGENEHAQEYTAALVLFDKHAELWTPAVVEQKVSA